ncbi:uncharacterized protein EHS24_001155 [Apiotrichum porosum]|uniref:Uncharacterized protein n=1 Tax=Apiotrichum porosum TaxID=105984 RepID=A0A427XK35_9TREE|nr:uncharacterized protein EHS24_001155 [Apiotrichum porosum]RSH79117.1 hypothetical protein EHS24_001155 [Apiotrichum porosum]
MAQGKTKGLKAKVASGGRKKSGTMSKGKRDIPPKNVHHVRERQTKKQLSSRINNNIEKQMVNAASSGKLTIMKNKGELEAGKGKK